MVCFWEYCIPSSLRSRVLKFIWELIQLAWPVYRYFRTNALIKESVATSMQRLLCFEKKVRRLLEEGSSPSHFPDWPYNCQPISQSGNFHLLHSTCNMYNFYSTFKFHNILGYLCLGLQRYTGVSVHHTFCCDTNTVYWTSYCDIYDTFTYMYMYASTNMGKHCLQLVLTLFPLFSPYARRFSE